MNKIRNFKINYQKIAIFLSIIGFILLLIYIFHTSTAILTSDSVITDVLSHEQKLNNELLLKHWYYGNEFWLFSLSIPTLIFSFFSSNQILIRQISVLITGILFFILLYKYSKKFLEKKDQITIIAIFASGISYSVLDYFYAFNAYLTVVINSLFLLFLYYKCFEDKKVFNKNIIYFILAIIVTFLLNMESLRYAPMITLPFIITEFILIIKNHLNGNILEFLKDKKTIKTICILCVAVVALVIYHILTDVYHFDARASNMHYLQIKTDNISKGFNALIDCVFNFFGFDNKNHPNTFMMPSDYFLPQEKTFSILSIRGISYFIKWIMCILTMVITPIYLWKHYKKLDSKIQFLLLFNTISWIIMIFSYFCLEGFFYHYHELKYFLTNIILNILLTIYLVTKFWVKKPLLKTVFQIFFILYIISNLYTTTVILLEHNQKTIDRRYELTRVLEKNNLDFGYADFWDGLLTYYLSNYKIKIAGVNYEGELKINRWYADERWYKNSYHSGKTFLVLNAHGKMYQEFYLKIYGKPNKKINTKHYTIFIYNKNPFYFSTKKTKLID